MTPRQQALAAYLATIQDAPRVRAAGFKPALLRDAVLSCIQEDLIVVLAFGAGNAAAKAEPLARMAARGVSVNVLGSALPPKAAAAAGDALDALVADGFDWVKGKLGEIVNKPEKKPARRS